MKRYRVIIIGLVMAMFFSLCACSSSDYKKADELLSSGNYDDALAIFEALSEKSYEDSSEKVSECKYLKASELFEKMDYSGASNLYSEIKGYRDADELGKQSAYYLGNLYAANDNYQLAYSIFSQLGDYEDSAKLAKICSELMITTATVGDYVFYGHYEQDGNTENGFEPIQWIVLGTDGDHVLLLSEYILEKRQFDSWTHYWETCSLRDWLNTAFYDGAFSSEERDSIQKMITSENTDDYVFCLSAEEVRGLFSSDESRRACPTQFLLDNGFKAWQNCGDWWTRSISTASNGKGVVPVEADGNVRSAGTVPYDWNAYTDIGVRPAIVLSSAAVSAAQNMKIFGFDSNTDLDHEPNLWTGGSTGTGGSSGDKCIVCNGTGYVKYYYGSSDLEAWLTGHDAYTVGPCTSCGGTGKAK